MEADPFKVAPVEQLWADAVSVYTVSGRSNLYLRSSLKISFLFLFNVSPILFLSTVLLAFNPGFKEKWE